MARKAASRKELGAAGLLGIARRCFEGIADPVAGRGGAGLADCLMSGLAVYGLKYASLPEFDEAARGDDAVRGNLRRLYGVDRAPSDTRMRERLDEVDPRSLRSCYRRLFAALQRGKGLEGFACLDGHYLLSVDGTGHHSSKKVHCPNCCGKHHRDGTTTYYHMMPGAVLVHPDEREVFPLAPEPIAKTDGSRENDCERNAAKRLLADVRREHPHLRLVVVEDALASNGPHIELLGKLDMRYIPGAKPGDHAFLFEWVDNTPGTRTAEFEDGDGTRHWFRWLNGAPLNDANFDLEVNFPEYREISAQGRERRFPWVTDLPVGEDDLMELMRAGRARWRLAGRQGRERDIQHPEEPGLRLRTQLRPRRQAPVDGAGAPDDAGLPDRPDPAALLRGVPPRAGAGEAAQVPVGAGAGRVPAGGGAGLGDAVRARHEGRGGRRGGQRHVVAGPPRPTVAGGGFFRDDESRRTTSTGPRRRVAPAPTVGTDRFRCAGNASGHTATALAGIAAAGEVFLTSMRETADRLETLRLDDSAYSVPGDFGDQFTWGFSLFKDEFLFEDVAGQVEEIKLRCAKKYLFHRFHPDTRYQVDQDYHPCHLELIGDPGTTFTLTQF